MTIIYLYVSNFQGIVGMKYDIVEVKAPLVPSIIHQTDYLIADFPHTGKPQISSQQML